MASNVAGSFTWDWDERGASYCCGLECKEIWYFVGVEIWFDGVFGALKLFQTSHTYTKRERNNNFLSINHMVVNIFGTRREYSPERTRRVLQPPFWPNNISVSNLSPTMHICDLRMPNLKSASKQLQLITNTETMDILYHKTNTIGTMYYEIFTWNLFIYWCIYKIQIWTRILFSPRIMLCLVQC